MTSQANGGRGSPPNKAANTSPKPLKLHWEGSRSAAENAKEKLPELAREFFAAGRELAPGARSFESLHRFRLLTKRFRYALELFRPWYGPGLGDRVEALRKLQTHLGDINDCAAAEELVTQSGSLSKLKKERL